MNGGLKVYRRQHGELDFVGCLTADATLGHLQENGEYLIQVDSADSRLFVDDAPLAMDMARRYWLWSPGFYAGEVVIELERPGRHEPECFRADVAPAAHKSGREQYREYIRQVADYAPQLLLGTEPARHGLGGRSEAGLSSWIRYARLRSFIEPYLATLRTIAERPMVRTRHYREQMPIHLARRVDVTTVRRLQTNPGLLAGIAGRQSPGCDPDLANNRLDVPFVEPTLDHPANRLMAAQLDAVLWLVAQLIDEFTGADTTTSETETDIRARMPRRIAYLAQLRKQLLKLSRQSPFNAVRRSRSRVTEILVPSTA